VAQANDAEPHWEVVSNFREREGISTYRPAATSSPDPRILEGRDISKTVNHQLALLVTTSIIIAGAVFNLSPRTLLWAGVSLAGLALLVFVGALVLRRPRGWKKPRLVASTEGPTVSDVLGVSRTVAWHDMLEPQLRQRSTRLGQEVRLEWSEPSGEHPVVILGDTVGLFDVYETRRSRAPEAITQQVYAKRAYGLE
jgi:hypothetical protein